MSDQRQNVAASAPAPSLPARVMGAAQQALHTAKELVTGNHDRDPSLQQSDQQFTESASAYASPEEQASGPSMREKIQQTLHNAKETVKDKLGLGASDRDVEMDRDTQDLQRMDTDYEISHSGSVAGGDSNSIAGAESSGSSSLPSSSSKQAPASSQSQSQGQGQGQGQSQGVAPSEQSQSQSGGMREKLHQAKESVKETLHNAQETVKDKLHMTKDKDQEITSKDKKQQQTQALKSAHQERYDSDPLLGFYDRAYHDNKSVWDLGRPQPSFVLFLAQQNLSREGSVLEVGCGTGEHIIHMASVGHRRCVGIDISDKAIHEAKLKATARGVAERVHFKKYDVRHLNELGSSFDIVIDVCFGHTIPVDMRQSYADHLRTVLNPGGLLYMFAYAGKNPHHAKDIYQFDKDNKDDNMDIDMEQGKNKTTTKQTEKTFKDDTVIVPEGMTGEIARQIFSADKGWRVDHVVFSEMDLAGGRTWPAMILAATFVGPKHSPAIPQKARDSTGTLQGVSTAMGEGALKKEDTDKNKQQQQLQKPTQQSVQQTTSK